MPRVMIGPALPDRDQLNVEIASLRDLDVAELRNRWNAAFGRRAPPHLPRHLLFRMLAYRLQAERLGDLDSGSKRLLDNSGSPEKAGHNALHLVRRVADAAARHCPGPRMERAYAAGSRACRRFCLERQDLLEPIAGRFRNYWHQLERAKVLWPAG